MTLTTRILIAMGLGVVIGSLINLLNNTSWISESILAGAIDLLVNDIFDGIGVVFVKSRKQIFGFAFNFKGQSLLLGKSLDRFFHIGLTFFDHKYLFTRF